MNKDEQKCVDAKKKEMRNGQIENAEEGKAATQKLRQRKNGMKKKHCLVEQQISIVTCLVMYNLYVQFAY